MDSHHLHSVFGACIGPGEKIVDALAQSCERAEVAALIEFFEETEVCFGVLPIAVELNARGSGEGDPCALHKIAQRASATFFGGALEDRSNARQACCTIGTHLRRVQSEQIG